MPTHSLPSPPAVGNMESPPISPISCHSPPRFSPSYPRAYEGIILGGFHSSSMESLSRRQSTYSRTSSDDSLYLPLDNHNPPRRRPFSGRNSSDDSLYAPVNNRQTIKRWNGIAREAINWNALPRDPELFFPTGNCLVYLYPAGHSQRGPSFRIPYHVLLYSGCQPLVQQCLVSTLNVSSRDRGLAKSLSPGRADYSMLEDTRTYLHLYPPAGLSRDESYSYHITTRNFFAWLLGVPLVGTDPVSALLDLKARMDIWRDANANNFEAIFEYARQQAYGDFEEIQSEMDKRLESETTPERFGVRPSEQKQTLDRQYRHNASIVRRNDSLKQGLRGSVARTSRPHIALQDKRVEPASSPIQKRQPLPRLTTLPHMLTGPTPVEADGAARRLSGPTRVQSSNAIFPSSSRSSSREMTSAHRHTGSCTSLSPVSPMAPVDSNGIDAALQRLTGPPSTESVVTASSSQVTKANKKKHRVSWADNSPTVAEARSSQTDLTYPNMQGLGLQSAQASSSAINISQHGAVARRPISSLPFSSNPVPGPSKRASMPASSTIVPWGEPVRPARPMSTASLISIPTMHQTSPTVKLEPCSCCGKMRRPGAAHSRQHNMSTSLQPEPCSCCGKMRKSNTELSQDTLPPPPPPPPQQQQLRPPSAVEQCFCSDKMYRPSTSAPYRPQQSRPASVRSMKSFRSTKSWHSLRSIRSSLSLRSIRSNISLSTFRSYLARKGVAKKSFTDIHTSMKDRRSSFKARLQKNKNQDPRVDPENLPGPDPAAPSCNPMDYPTPRPRSRYPRTSLHSRTPAPVELEAESVPMKTVPEMASSDSNPWSPDSYSNSPLTPPEDLPVVATTIRPKEIYTSGEYRHQPTPRRTANVNNFLHLSEDDFDPNAVVLDIGTPGGFEEDFVDTLIAQLEAAGIAERTPSTSTSTSKSKSKGKRKATTEHVFDDEGGIWMGMKSNVGVPRVEVGAMG